MKKIAKAHEHLQKLARMTAVFLVNTGSIALSQDVPHPCLKDTMLVFDASGSMGTTDFTAKKPHIERVKEALRKVTQEIPPERAVSTFASKRLTSWRTHCGRP